MLSKKIKLSFLRGPLILVLVCPFILLAPLWLAGKALYWGTPSSQFVPWWWQAWQSLRSGEWPLWNPLVGMGAPLLANYQSALFYPPTWIYFGLAAIGGSPLMAWGQSLMVAAHLAWAGWGMVLLLRRMKLGELAQTIGGLAFSLSGYLVARAHFLSINAAVSWLPWILLAAYELAVDPKGKRAMLKLAFFLALQWLAGHAQISWYTLILATVWTIFWARSSGGWRAIRSVLVRFATAGLLAFAVSAVQLLPTAEYLLQSQRATQVEIGAAMAYSFWPWRFIGLLAPNFFGNPAHGDYFGYGNYWEDAIYIGVLPLGLALAALWSARIKNKARPLVIFLGILILVSFLLALGNHTPLFPWLYQHIPSFDIFQGPTRFSIWAIFALCLLAALGAESWRQPQGRSLYWARLAVAVALAVLLGAGVAVGLEAIGILQIHATFIFALFSAAIVATAIAFLNLRTSSPGQRGRRWAWAACLLLAADLLYAGWGLNPAGTLELYKEDTGLHAAVRAELNGGRLYLPPSDEQDLKYGMLFRFDTFFSEDPRSIRATLLPNINLLDRIPSVNNFDPLVPARYKTWVDAVAQANPETQKKMLASVNVSVIEHLIPAEGASVSFDPFETLTRARWVNCANIVSASKQALEQVTTGQINPTDNLVVEIPDSQVEKLCGSGEQGSVEIVAASANHVRVSVNAPGGGWLILADTWFPGWEAIANGEQLPIYPAFGVVRAVPLPSGRYDLEFVYRPLSFSFGLILTVLGVAAFAFFWRRLRNE
jgi:hypothetical protein